VKSKIKVGSKYKRHDYILNGTDIAVITNVTEDSVQFDISYHAKLRLLDRTLTWPIKVFLHEFTPETKLERLLGGYNEEV
jgi:hypothetical protein